MKSAAIICAVGIVCQSGLVLGAEQVNTALITLVAESNRLNRGMLNAVSLEYSTSIRVLDGGKPAVGPDNNVDKTGRYAFKGEQVFQEEVLTSCDNLTLRYVRSGEEVRCRVSSSKMVGGVVLIGTREKCTIKPGSLDPWSQVDDGVSDRLDKLPEGSEVTEILPVVEGGVEYVKAVVVCPNGPGVRVPYTIWYSVKNNYLPVRHEYSWRSSDGSLTGSGEVTSIGEYEINGSTVYLPLAVRTRRVVNDQTTVETVRNTNPSSVEINPCLSDELFVVAVQDGDQLIDKDTDLELIGPGGRNLLMGVTESRMRNLGPSTQP